MDSRQAPPSFDDVRAALQRISRHVHRTPVVTCATLDALVGTPLFFKCENLQKVGAFKYRGASNAIWKLSDDQLARGVATHSSGNHAQALALAARQRGAKAWIVMPSTSLAGKVAAVEGYGGQIVFCENTLEARESELKRIVDETGAEEVHPYDDDRVIAGQGTVALELLEDVDELDALITPVGGGGLLSGSALTVRALRPQMEIYGAEPELADDAFESLKTGKRQAPRPPVTVADGLRTALGVLPFEILKRDVDDILLVSEEEIVAAMHLIWERAKLVVEPSAAVALAALLRYSDSFRGKRVGVVLSGGNVELPRG